MGRLFEQNQTAPLSLQSSLPVHHLALALIAFAAFAPVFFATDFIWDDFTLLRSSVLGSAGGLHTIWFNPRQHGGEEHYWPMTYTVFHLQRLLWGTDVVLHHAVNVALHAANACILYSILMRIPFQGAWLASALFAVHPIHVESVAWVIELKDVLSGLFYLLGALIYVRFTSGGRSAVAVLSLIFYILALFSKSIAVTLPAGLVILLWYGRSLDWRREGKWLGAMAGIGLAITLMDLRMVSTNTSTPIAISALEQGVIIIKNLALYMLKAFVPIQLQPIYPKWNTGFDAIAAMLMTGGGAILVLLFYLRSRNRGSAAAIAFFLVTIGPVLGLIKFSYMQFSYTADRFQYLASIGPICLLTGGIFALQQKPASARWFIPTATAVLVTFFALTFSYAEKYTSEEKLFSYNLRHNADSEIAHTRLGIIYSGRGEFQKALMHFERSAGLAARDAGTHYNVAFAAWKSGDVDGAKKSLGRALELKPDYKKAADLLVQVEKGSALQK